FFDRVYDMPKSSKIIVDDLSGAKEATAHLIDQGCQRIAHLEGPPNLEISKQRLEGYLQAHRDRNREIDQRLIMPLSLGTIEEGKAATQKLLAQEPRPDAIFATNDPAAMGAMQAIKEAGLRIPDDISVVGFSNWFFTALLDPPLTSVDQPGFEMGQGGAKLLIRQIGIEEKVRDG